MLRTTAQQFVNAPAQQLRLAREVLASEARAVAAVAERLDDSFLHAVDLVSQCIGTVLTTGVGKAGHVAQKSAATLASTGTAAHFLHPTEAVHGDLGRVRAGDVVIAFSHGGETEELNRILRPMQAFGAAVVGITSRDRCTLARLADAAIVYGPVDEACPLRLAPSTSCAVMLAISDALAFVLMQIRDFTAEDFGRFHPAGSLGRQFQVVDDIMRFGPQLRIAECSLTVREVFTTVARPGRRTGATMLVDASGKLAGLFTDSDLARLLERRDSIDRPIHEVMTRNPITLRSGSRVAQAVELLRDRRISEIPVVDAADRPIGLVDITDLFDLVPEAA